MAQNQSYCIFEVFNIVYPSNYFNVVHWVEKCSKYACTQVLVDTQWVEDELTISSFSPTGKLSASNNPVEVFEYESDD